MISRGYEIPFEGIYKLSKMLLALDASIYEFYATMKTRVFYDAFEDAGFKVGAGSDLEKAKGTIYAHRLEV